MTFALHAGAEATRALEGAVRAPYWLDRASAPASHASLDGPIDADLVIIGAGFTGLWAAWRALERNPGQSVVVLDAESVAFGASGRNGGFVAASLTHGLTHGTHVWPTQVSALQREGERNLEELINTIRDSGIDCDLRLSGKTTIATEEWQVEGLRSAQRLGAEHGESHDFLDQDAMRADVHSPTYLAGLRDRAGTVLVDPALLAWGMAERLEAQGVRFFDHSAARDIRTQGAGVRVVTDAGHVDARQAIVATAAYRARCADSGRTSCRSTITC